LRAFQRFSKYVLKPAVVGAQDGGWVLMLSAATPFLLHTCLAKMPQNADIPTIVQIARLPWQNARQLAFSSASKKPGWL
jgi:hypothetical protein